MFRQIRSLLSEPDMQLEGSTVEVDEMYYGASQEQHWPLLRGDKGRKAIRGWSSRAQRAASLPVLRLTPLGKTLRVREEYVPPKSTVVTDEYSSYAGLDRIEGMSISTARESIKRSYV